MRITNMSVGRAGVVGDNFARLGRALASREAWLNPRQILKITQKPALFHLPYDSKRHDFFSLPCVAAKKRDRWMSLDVVDVR